MSRSIVPRGFSRFYVLSLLKETAMTGKQIIQETEQRSKGTWKPSPGLVYPLLGKLLSEGLIEETKNGYQITTEGEKLLQDYASADKEFEKWFGTLVRLGMFGKFMAQDAVDRIIRFFGMIREDVSNLGVEQRAKYKAFLRAELEKLEEKDG
jgi:DNA-binding PadR family transcriptional regulator